MDTTSDIYQPWHRAVASTCQLPKIPELNTNEASAQAYYAQNFSGASQTHEPEWPTSIDLATFKQSLEESDLREFQSYVEPVLYFGQNSHGESRKHLGLADGFEVGVLPFMISKDILQVHDLDPYSTAYISGDHLHNSEYLFFHNDSYYGMYAKGTSAKEPKLEGFFENFYDGLFHHDATEPKLEGFFENFYDGLFHHRDPGHYLNHAMTTISDFVSIFPDASFAELGDQDTPILDDSEYSKPITRPISQDQLIAEVKGIYAGLVMVEAKCTEVETKQAQVAMMMEGDKSDPVPQRLNNEQWEAITALYRTLERELDDFLLATQHPSASPLLKKLASKYAKSKGMWKNGFRLLQDAMAGTKPQSFQEYLDYALVTRSMGKVLWNRFGEQGPEMNEILRRQWNFRMDAPTFWSEDEKEMWRLSNFRWRSELDDILERDGVQDHHREHGPHMAKTDLSYHHQLWQSNSLLEIPIYFLQYVDRKIPEDLERPAPSALADVVDEHIIKPLCRETEFALFHHVLEGTRQVLSEGWIVCLKDFETFVLRIVRNTTPTIHQFLRFAIRLLGLCGEFAITISKHEADGCLLAKKSDLVKYFEDREQAEKNEWCYSKTGQSVGLDSGGPSSTSPFSAPIAIEQEAQSLPRKRRKVDDSYRCSRLDCKKAFQTPSELKKHIARHDRNLYCPIATCEWAKGGSRGIGFDSVSNRGRHTRASHDERRYKCPICEHVAIRSDYLQKHIRSTHDR